MKNKKDLFWIIVSLLAVMAVMVMIFIFSSFEKEKSASQSDLVTEVVVKLIYPGSVKWDAEKRETVYVSTGSAIRKLAHFGEFMLLGATLMLHLYAVNKARRIKNAPVVAFTVGTVYAVSDEVHQLFVEGRSGNSKDVIIDTAGVAAGICLTLFIIWLAGRVSGRASRDPKGKAQGAAQREERTESTERSDRGE